MSDLNFHCAPGVPDDVQKEFEGNEDGEAIAYVYDCVLLERKTRKGHHYTAVNRTTGKRLKFEGIVDTPFESIILNMLKTIRFSDIAGFGELQADRPIDEKISLSKAKEIITALLDSTLPELSCNIEAEHKALARKVLGAMTMHEMRLLDADISEFNILCSLIPVVIVKSGRMNDLHARRIYPYMQYADMPRMPIIISVPSKTLRHRIINETLPLLSDVLLKYGVINEALTFVERKGHNNYACYKKANDYYPLLKHKNRYKQQYKELKRNELVDLNEFPWLSAKEKSIISADGNCVDNCPGYNGCKYVEHLNSAKSYDYDIQVCTHRYLVADTQKRAEGSRPLLPNYQSLVVYDALDCMQVAEEMYSVSISNAVISLIIDSVTAIVFHCHGLRKNALKYSKQLNNEGKKLFNRLTINAEKAKNGISDDAGIDMVVMRCLRKIRDITTDILNTLYSEAFYIKTEELLKWVHNRYGADMTPIDISFLQENPISDSDKVRLLVNSIYKAICNLKEIKERAITEKVKIQKKGYDDSTGRRVFLRHKQNTELEAIKNVDSLVYDVIEEQAKKLLQFDYPTGKRSWQILRLAQDVRKLFDCTDTVIKDWAYTYKFKTGNKWSCLQAIPKDVSDVLFSEHRLRKLPAVFFPGELPKDLSFDDFKQKYGLDTRETLYSYLPFDEDTLKAYEAKLLEYSR